MTTYVCGLLFDPSLSRVVLIKKNRGPRHMAGKLNGVGGKIEIGESPRGAMSREFKEEAGVDVNPLTWSCFHTEQYFADTNNKVYFMCGYVSAAELDACRTIESEEIHIVHLTSNGVILGLPKGLPLIYNLHYLIPMAMSWINNPLDHYFEG